MYAKIIDWVISYISQTKKEENQIFLTEEQAQIILNGGKYEDGKFIEREISNEEKMLDEINKANQEFQNSIHQLTAEYTPEEISSFDIKLRHAELIKAGTIQTSTLIEGTLLEGETLSEMVDKIIANSKAYQKAYAAAEKILRAKTKEIKNKYK